jgi:transposase-like protein
MSAMPASTLQADRNNDVPDKLAMDQSGANKAAVDAINAGQDVPIVVRQVNYLNNIVEQDHRALKRLIRPMLNFKSLRIALSKKRLAAAISGFAVRRKSTVFPALSIAR